MTISVEPGYGTAGSAGGLAVVRRGIAARLARSILRCSRALRRPRAASSPSSREMSFEIHVEQALSIARAVPTLQAVRANAPRRSARS